MEKYKKENYFDPVATMTAKLILGQKESSTNGSYFREQNDY